MTKVTRNEFLRLGLMASLAPLAARSWANNWETGKKDETLMLELVQANDQQVDELLLSIQDETRGFSRRIGSDFSCMAASYVTPSSKHFHSPAVISRLQILVAIMQKYQTSDGTVNIANLESPPDTAFLIELLCPGLLLLRKDASTDATNIFKSMQPFMVKSGEALATGGVHTPNHRWVISAALSQLNELYPNRKYVARIDEWLSEGVFMDKDGHYPERSAIYSAVEDTAFSTIGRLLKRPSLFDPVRKNLRMAYYYMEPSGQMVTTDSRRQDQYLYRDILLFYFPCRYLAIRDQDPFLAAMVQFMENMPNFKKDIVSRGLFNFLENEVLQEQLPSPANLPVEYEKLVTSSSLLRIRRGDMTATLFGGADWPIIIASGRSNSPNFFSYRKGKAILKYMRLSTSFFSMGYFYSDGLTKKGATYELHKKLNIPYYQPLPAHLKNKTGDYKLSPSIDDRFWNKMDFKNRPVSNVKSLDTTITFSEMNRQVVLKISVQGLKSVPVTVELCFDEKGKLTGLPAPENGNYFLEKGTALYECDGDTIEFGPGNLAHKNITALEGERYSTHFGSLRTEGLHVFITGTTPFEHTLTFK